MNLFKRKKSKEVHFTYPKWQWIELFQTVHHLGPKNGVEINFGTSGENEQDVGITVTIKK